MAIRSVLKRSVLGVAMLVLSACTQEVASTQPQSLPLESEALREPTNKNCSITGDFPIRTHFKNGVGPQIGGTDLPVVDNPDILNQIMTTLDPVLRFIGYVPEFNRYYADNFDVLSYSDANVKGSLEYLCSANVTTVRFTQPTAEITTAAALAALIRPNERSFQVIHGIVFRKNLFTIIVPPLWASTKKYATALNGLYSLNGNLVENEGPELFRLLSSVFQQDGKGAVGVLWNGGGAVVSLTVNDRAYTDLNDFFKLVVPAVGLHADKVVTFGTSRGGLTALNLAAHPAVTQFRVAFAHATVPPSDWDVIANHISTTIPLLTRIIDTSSGYVASWQDDFRTPFTGRTGREQMLNVQTGTSNQTALRTSFNLTAAPKIAKLKAGNTSVLLEVGSHDYIVPTIDQNRLSQVYNREGVAIETRVNYFAGHRGFVEPRTALLKSALLRLNTTTNARAEVFATKGLRRNYLVNAQTGMAETWNLPYADRPLTLEFPRFVINEAPGHILATGVPGKRYVVVARDESQGHYTYTIEIDQDGVATFDIDRAKMVLSLHTVIGVYELDGNANPIRKLQTRSNVRANGPIQFARYTESTRTLSPYIDVAIMQSAFGPNFEYQYLENSKDPITMDYGLLEIGAEPISASDAIFVRGLLNRERRLVQAAAAEELWPVSAIIDGNGGTSYSSPPHASTAANGRFFIAGWLASAQSANRVYLKARMVNGVPLGFPKSYVVYVTSPNSTTEWLPQGVHTVQPDANGNVVIPIPQTNTWGVGIIPVELSTDGSANYYLQMAEIGLVQQ